MPHITMKNAISCYHLRQCAFPRALLLPAHVSYKLTKIKTRLLHLKLSAFGLGCLLLAALSGLALAGFDEGHRPKSSEPFLRPLEVVSTSGNVLNAEALVGGQSGDATLTWSGVGDPPLIVLDYGRVVGGCRYSR